MAQPAISYATFSAGGAVQANGDVLSLGQPFAGTGSGGSFGIVPVITGAARCPADFNASGGPPTVQDIFDFLAAYFAQDPRADFNGVGGISVQDVFDFLAAYFTSCS